jgi:exosortase B
MFRMHSAAMDHTPTSSDSSSLAVSTMPERIWLPIGVGLLVLFVPTLVRLFTVMWDSADVGHAPIILVLSLWLMHDRWNDMMRDSAGHIHSTLERIVGWVLLAGGLLCYLVGRAVNIIPMEMGSFIILAGALLLVVRGTKALKRLWFPLFFMLFMIPLPGPLVSMLTLPMKMAVSAATEWLLYALDFPISRTGVILQIGPYQLLVADACAGLQTLLTLEALGMFYMNLMRHNSPFRNIMLGILIVPISFAANVIRVCTLVLVTFYLGDEAGQGFLHGFAGMVLFVSALLLILSIDNLLQKIVKWHAARLPAGEVPS